MKKKQLQKILSKKYIRIPVPEDEQWPKKIYVKRPSSIIDVDWRKFNTEEEVGRFLINSYQIKNTEVVGKMKANLRLMTGDFAALKGDVVNVSWWWKDGHGDRISYQELDKLNEDDLDKIQLCLTDLRMVGDWDYDYFCTDEVEICQAYILGDLLETAPIAEHFRQLPKEIEILIKNAIKNKYRDVWEPITIIKVYDDCSYSFEMPDDV